MAASKTFGSLALSTSTLSRKSLLNFMVHFPESNLGKMDSKLGVATVFACHEGISS